MSHKAFTLLLSLSLGLLATTAWAGDTPQQDDPASSKALANQQCAIGEEKFLPGDYYYCLGTQAYGQGYYDRAQKFFTTAASWASKPAQYVLGVMALNGDRQSANRPLAIAWFALAAERHREDFVAAYQKALAQSSEADKHAAEALLRQMRPTYADATAAVRAERRYHDGMAAVKRAGGNSGVQCISGVQPIGADPNGSNSTVACLQLPQFVETIDKAAPNVFEGWGGHVTVGDLQPVNAPDAPSK